MQTAAFGKLCCRVLLHYLGKEKQHREPTGFENLAKIAELFTKDLSGKQGGKVGTAEEAKEQELKVTNCFSAEASSLALLQNPHLKIGEGRDLIFLHS